MAQINKPTNYFNTKLYTGTGAENAITGVGFQPDIVWIKDRNGSANRSWVNVDSVRGATKRLKFDQTSGESTETEMVKTLDSDGFTLGTTTTSNNSGTNFLSHCFLAGGTASSNTDGSITSSVSANTTSGISVVSYTGTGSAATVGHGIGAIPKMIIVKRTDTTGRWQVYHSEVGATKYLFLDGTEAPSTASNRWNDTSPTSSVFSLGTSTEVNGSGGTYIAYCFAEKPGFSKFGSYIGNGSADGPFLYFGFKPAYYIAKETTSAETGPWRVRDNKRYDQVNPIDKAIRANSYADELDEDDHDFLSNGVKVRTTGEENNGSGDTYIYAAFAAEPLVGTNNIPATAR